MRSGAEARAERGWRLGGQELRGRDLMEKNIGLSERGRLRLQIRKRGERGEVKLEIYGRINFFINIW